MLENTIALVIFLFPLAFSPGPGNMFFAANSARFGMRATLPANLGYHGATWLVTAAIGFGFSSGMQEYPHAFRALKLIGGGYVLYLAWQLFRSGVMKNSATARPASFIDGAILLVVNPKAYVIITLMFSQFLGQTAQSQAVAVLLITTVFTMNNFVAFNLWMLVGDGLASHFRTPDKARILNNIFGTILAAVAIWMLLF